MIFRDIVVLVGVVLNSGGWVVVVGGIRTKVNRAGGEGCRGLFGHLWAVSLKPVTVPDFPPSGGPALSWPPF